MRPPKPSSTILLSFKLYTKNLFFTRFNAHVHQKKPIHRYTRCVLKGMIFTVFAVAMVLFFLEPLQAQQQVPMRFLPLLHLAANSNAKISIRIVMTMGVLMWSRLILTQLICPTFYCGT
jgi:hypothetical protein